MKNIGKAISMGSGGFAPAVKAHIAKKVAMGSGGVISRPSRCT